MCIWAALPNPIIFNTKYDNNNCLGATWTFLTKSQNILIWKISGLSLLLDLNPRICHSKAEWYFHQKDCSLEVDFLITLWPLFHFAQNTEFTVFFHPVKNTFTNDVNLHSHKIDCSRTFELNLHQQFFLTHFIQCYIY